MSAPATQGSAFISHSATFGKPIASIFITAVFLKTNFTAQSYEKSYGFKLFITKNRYLCLIQTYIYGFY